MKNKISDY